MASDSLPTPPSATPTPTSAASAAGRGGGTATATVAQPTPTETLDGLLEQITTSNSLPALASTLRNFAGVPEARDVVLTSPTSAGADPLDSLDVGQHTIGILFILSARLTYTATTTTAPDVPFTYIDNFCRHFDPEQARFAPERVTLLAKGIVQRAEVLGRGKAAITPLRHLLTRYTPDLSYLTTIHPIFVTACATAGFFNVALPVLAVPISQISTTLFPDLRYQDHLVYHFVGGILLAALRRYEEAAEFFELCASAPVLGASGGSSGVRGPSQGPIGMGMGMSMGMGMIPPGPGSRYLNFGGPSDPSVFQVEAAKKLLLVQLIVHGKTSPLPKYTHPAVSNLKGTAYNALARVYPNLEQVHAIASKEEGTFIADDNFGLLRLVVERAPRWAIKKLTETYLTLSLPEIGRVAGVEDVEEVRRVVLSMIETGEIEASIDATGSVTFEDDEPPTVSKVEIDRVLRVAQEQEQVLRKLEREIARSKDYLQKVRLFDSSLSCKKKPLVVVVVVVVTVQAVRSREEGSSPNWPYIEEDLLAGEESVY
ncbi:hypothetical protein B0F90DRAFT_1702545 [Multifurca ochricompacta]|uniref:COP9 signalosome complex subunit 3 n=1 Tax=Multifurca ochricompacta TaxID=376703 RepID=A0AAD4M844_9AGAM|nr:hypothetical protein B0F90DRAFT_1702545 [Multifurca ochricompacta]